MNLGHPQPRKPADQAKATHRSQHCTDNNQNPTRHRSTPESAPLVVTTGIGTSSIEDYNAVFVRVVRNFDRLEMDREGMPVRSDRIHFAPDRAILLVCQCLDTGQLLSLKELERGTATGGDVRDLVGNAGLVNGAYRVAAADD